MLTKADKKELDQVLDQIFAAKDVIDSLAEAYRAKYDDLSEKAQGGDRGEKLDETASKLEQMSDDAENLLTNGSSLTE